MLLNNKLILGSYNGSIGCLQGSIGTVHIYDRALSDSEVLSNYAIYSNRYLLGIVQSGLLLHVDPNNLQSYPGSGIILYNLVNTQYNGVMSNGASFGTDFTGGYIATDGTNDFVKFPITRSTVPYTVFAFALLLQSCGEQKETEVKDENQTETTHEEEVVAEEVVMVDQGMVEVTMEAVVMEVAIPLKPVQR